MFITFEGIDLCGKSTQARLLYEYLKSLGKKVIMVREPGGTVISEKIRNILLDKEHDKMKYLTEFLLFSASRHQLTEEVIKPHLKKKYIVICDRYYDSSTAYQGYGGDLDLKVVNSINKIATGNFIPDISFLIDISYTEGLKRRTKMKKSHDRIESKKLKYYKKVSAGYLEIARNEKKRFVVINGNDTIINIQKEILSHLNF